MAEVLNGRTARLAIAGVFDGTCGLQGERTVAFPSSPRRLDRVVGLDAELDGEPMRVASIARSKITAGFYVAELEPRA